MPGLIPLIKKVTPDRPVLYRSHIQIRSDLVAKAGSPQADIWDFLWNNIQGCDMFISHPIPIFVPHNVPREKVVYLPATTDYDDPGSWAGSATVHGFRPRPADGAVEAGPHELFWSLSFAATSALWQHVGGFDEGYSGYGGEDTDFGLVARDRGVDVLWVGGATAYHQHHPTADPPVQHLDDILANGARFARRWGFWPMRGWLDAFEQRGLVTLDPATGHYSRTEPAS